MRGVAPRDVETVVTLAEADSEVSGEAAPGRAGPSSDHIEVNVFGPGAGESIAVHLGSDAWLIVDSCSSVRGGVPAALEYLESIGRIPANVVKYLVATHWHDDHVHGFAKLVKACPNATVWVTSAVNINELNALFRRSPERLRAGTKEFAEVLKALQGNGSHTRPDRHYLVAGDRSRLDEPPKHPGGWDGAIHALSPSAEDGPYALREILNLLQQAEVDRSLHRKVGEPNRNHSSVVLHVRAGDQAILLGGDRERTRASSRGWTSAIRAAQALDLIRASVYKVAHHGAPNGDAQEIWDSLLTDDRIAVVAPYYRGVNGGRPRLADARRILRRAPRSWITSTVPPGKTGDDDGDVVDYTDVEAAGVQPTVEYAEPPMGHVQMRLEPGSSSWQVEAFDPAGHINDLIATFVNA